MMLSRSFSESMVTPAVFLSSIWESLCGDKTNLDYTRNACTD